MKTRTMRFFPGIRGAAVIAACAFLTNAHTATLVFDPSVTINFENLGIGDPVSDIGWTGATSYFVGTAPRTGNSSDVVLGITDETRRAVFSSEQSPTFTGNTLYFSYQISMADLSTSGARIQIASNNTSGSGTGGKLGGFGVMDAITPPPGGGTNARYRLTFYDPTDGGWKYSATTLAHSTWYELALVIELNEITPGESLGYFYYRTLEQEEFTLLPEFSGYQMSWYTADFNASDFAYWRVENARNGVQLDNFSAGMVIPEPGSAALFGMSALAVSIFFRRRRR